MQVQDDEYYYINRTVSYSSHKPLAQGDVLDAGAQTNPFFRTFETRRLTVPVNVGNPATPQKILALSFLRQVQQGTGSTPNLPQIAVEAVDHLVKSIRELVWEDVRRREFPHLPSRQRCIWLIPPSLDSLRFWINRLQVKPGSFQVLKLRVQGRVHVASETHLLNDSESLEEAMRMARRYWLGIVDDSLTQEIIFEGRAEVLSVVDPADYPVPPEPVVPQNGT